MSSKTFCFSAVSLSPMLTEDQHGDLKRIVAEAENWSPEQQEKFLDDFLTGLWLLRNAGGPTPKELHLAWSALDRACAALTEAVEKMPAEAWAMSSIRATQAMDNQFGEIEEPESLARFLSEKAGVLRGRIGKEVAALPKPDKATKPRRNAQRAMADAAIEAYRGASGELPPCVKGDAPTAWLYRLLNTGSKYVGLGSGESGIGWDLYRQALLDAISRE